MKMFRPFLLVIGILSVLTFVSCSPSTSYSDPPQYYSPLQNAEYVSTGATIAVRYGPALTAQNISGLNFTVQGAKSGLHDGKVVLADDHKTVIFKPASPFTPGEQVTVNVNGLDLDLETIYQALSYNFTVAANQKSGSVGGTASTPPPANSLHSAFPNFLTLPHDIPHYSISQAVPNSSEGDIFVAPFYWTMNTLGSYLLILDPQGQIVYYKSVADQLSAFDFKVQPNGLISYFDQKDSVYYIMDSHYRVVGKYQAGNGYVADLHELQILPNGNALLMAYDAETIDMSKLVNGGDPKASVVGLIIQELDPSRNVIFEWRSWDHFAISDTTLKLTDSQLDLVHGNALALANDGNLLLSSRNQSEITKIDLQTGGIIWRLGGKGSTLKFVGGQPFAYQHDVRQLPNGDITVFDNQATTQNPGASMVLEYKIDEAQKTATQVWSSAHTPPVFSTFMGDAQRFADGNTFVDWGAAFYSPDYSFITATEVGPDGKALFDLAFDRPYVSYRAFRFPWQGFPDTLPALAYKADGTGLLLGYSWNGTTEVTSYKVYGGSSLQALALIEQKTKTDFETQSHLADLPQNECYFQVAALDEGGHELARSKVISTAPGCPEP